MHRAYLIRLAVALAATAVFAQAALAWGEPKNQPPFMHRVPQQRSIAAANHAVRTDVRGERKNQLPFTRRVAP
jgi:hypothetical protein